MNIEKECDDYRTLTCPSCGSKALIEESDAVITARIRAEIEGKALDNELYKEQIVYEAYLSCYPHLRLYGSGGV